MDELLALVAQRDFLDFPTAWAIQRAGIEHTSPKCSAVPGSNGGMGGPFFLCDCGAVEARWEELRALAAALLGVWIDYSSGRVSGAAMKAAGVIGAFRYVGVGGTGKRLNRAEYQDHLAHGRQTVAVVERVTTDADGGAAAGTANAHAALADLATITAGLAPIRYVLMVNDQNRDTATEVAYVRAAAAVLVGYVVGPYGFGAFLASCAAAGLAPVAWQAGPAPSRTGTAAVSTWWQRQGGPAAAADGPATPVTRVIDGVTCDLTNQLKEITVALTDPLPPIKMGDGKEYNLLAGDVLRGLAQYIPGDVAEGDGTTGHPVGQYVSRILAIDDIDAAVTKLVTAVTKLAADLAAVKELVVTMGGTLIDVDEKVNAATAPVAGTYPITLNSTGEIVVGQPATGS
ncbi:MAG TPA: hypothetical protein VHV49_14230 [Pseudonocardiaceae bacterium]|nr:hypothetical protein [Pseudonocardiaceae bacterium]